MQNLTKFYFTILFIFFLGGIGLQAQNAAAETQRVSAKKAKKSQLKVASPEVAQLEKEPISDEDLVILKTEFSDEEIAVMDKKQVSYYKAVLQRRQNAAKPMTGRILRPAELKAIKEQQQQSATGKAASRIQATSPK